MQPTQHRLRLLIVEDEYLIADQMAKFFAKRGTEVIGFAPTARKAREIISRGTQFDVAILDVRLADGDVFPIADMVRKLGADLVFYTGLEPNKLPERFRTTMVVSKPEDVDALYASTMKTCRLSLERTRETADAQ
jgi:DNA-binding NtrC family response regulator